MENMKISCNNCGYSFMQIGEHHFHYTKNEYDSLISSYTKEHAKCPHCQGALVEIK